MSRLRDSSFAVRAIAAAAGGLALSAAYPPIDLGAASSIAGLAGFLYAIDGATGRASLLLGLIFGCAAFGSGCFWLFNVFGPAGMVLVLYVSLFTVAFAFLSVKLLEKSEIIAMMGLPVLWTALEFTRGELGPLANTTLLVGGAVPGGPFLAPARFVGVYGLSFAAALCASLLFFSLSGRSKKSAPAGLVLLPAAWYGLGCLVAIPPSTGPWLDVLAVQGEDIPVDSLIRISERGLAEKKARFVVWPEHTLDGSYIEENTKLRKILSDFTRSNRVYLVFGNRRRAENGAHFNTAFIMDDSGRIIGSARKSRPVPFMNDGIPTPQPRLISTKWGTIALPICYDADFSLVERGLASRGAELFIVPTRDVRHWGWFQHLQRVRMLRLRGIENGRWVLRVASSGPSVLVAPDGSYACGLWNDRPGFFHARMQFRRDTTLATDLGFLVGPLCLCLSCLLLCL